LVTFLFALIEAIRAATDAMSNNGTYILVGENDRLYVIINGISNVGQLCFHQPNSKELFGF
jgi:hypothetical protein